MAKSDVFSYNTEIYSVKKTNKVLNALIYVGLIVWLLIDLFPLYYLFTSLLRVPRRSREQMLSVFPRNGCGATMPEFSS